MIGAQKSQKSNLFAYAWLEPDNSPYNPTWRSKSSTAKIISERPTAIGRYPHLLVECFCIVLAYDL